MTQCGSKNCSVSISDNAVAIQCSGFCDKSFHLTCVAVTKTMKKNLNDNILWFCDDCVNIQKSGLTRLLNINEEFAKIKDENESLIKKACDKIKKDIDTKFQSFENNLKSLLEEKEINIKSSYKEILNENVSSLKDSYAEITKKNSKKSNKKQDPVVVIKPKNKTQTTDKTKSDLKAQVEPREVDVNGILKASDGGIIIRCKNVEATEKIKEIVENKMSEKYDVNIPSLKNPRLKIVGVEDPPQSLDEIKNILIKQNPELFNNQSILKVISAVKIQKNKNTVYHNVIIETDGSLYNKIMSVENTRINFDWNRCKVFDAINVKRCFKCCSYSHLASECKSSNICFKCAGNHVSSNCTENFEKCVNCDIHNRNLKTNIDVNHNAMSLNCPIYRKMLTIRKRNINYQ